MTKYLRLTCLLLLTSYFLPLTSYAQWNAGGIQISSSIAQNHRPMISTTIDGGMYITWLAGNDETGLGSIMLVAINAQGSSFPGWINGGIEVYNVNSNFAPVVITSEDQGAIVAWYGYPEGSANGYIYVQKYSFEGVAQWNSGTTPVRVSVDLSRNDKYPNIVSDRDNGVYIAWTSYNAVEPNSPDVYIQHIDNTGNVAAGWSADPSGVAVTENLRESMPRIVLSPDKSAVYVMYNEGLSEIALKLKKVNTSDGTLASSWPAGGAPLSIGPNVMPDPTREQYIFCDKKNNVVAFWLDSHLPDLNYEVYMQRVSPSGGLQLSYGGVYIGGKGLMVEGAYSGTKYFDASQDSDDNFLLVFANYDNDAGDDINAMKVKADGTVIWDKSPITTTHHCDYQKVLPDGRKGMYIFYKGGSPYTLYALAVDSTGKFYEGITEPGIAFGAIDNYESLNPNYDFAVKANCLGRAVVAWDRYRDNGQQYNIFACNLLRNFTSCAFDDFTCTVSVPETNNNTLIDVFPNPFNNNINIQLSGINDKNIDFKIFDITGKQIEQWNINNSQLNNNISTENLSNGLYFYFLQEGNTIIKKGKLIKM